MADPRNMTPRRRVLQFLAGLGVASPVLARAVTALAEEGAPIDKETIRRAEWISGLELTDEKRELMVEGLRQMQEQFARLRALPLDNSVPPALAFDPFAARPGARTPPGDPDRSRHVRLGPPSDSAPDHEDDVAFASIRQLSAWLRGGHLSARELADLSLARLEKHDPALHCVIERTVDVARAQADAADRRLAEARKNSGDGPGEPLLGIPWGAKDLLSWPGTRTTWGAKPYEDQIGAVRSTAAANLEAAGATLVAKLTVGALAWGDVWFGGKTRNPWNVEQGSSGSSAGPASATAAGLVTFALGTETWGSILSPATVCGLTGLRPTFGRVSRHGCMALAWSMDKIGPIARSAEDCALVFGAIHGADGLDPVARSVEFAWPPARPRPVRIGVLRAEFDRDRAQYAGDEDGDEATTVEWWKEWEVIDRGSLDTLANAGFELVDCTLPGDVPISDLAFILTAEAATAFDDLTRSGRDDLLVRQVAAAWPNVFRQGQMIPAVEYLRANRHRTRLLAATEAMFDGVDVIVAPTWVGDTLLLTNLSGHPQLCLPNGLRTDGTPTSLSFVGRLDGEEALLAVARAFQEVTDFHRRRPPGFVTG
ncbi:MAG: amidase [bacterium]